jgi:hypothetical protein
MVRSLHAKQNTCTPVHIALWTLIIHFLVACTFMWGTVGLALASTLAILMDYRRNQHGRWHKIPYKLACRARSEQTHIVITYRLYCFYIGNTLRNYFVFP